MKLYNMPKILPGIHPPLSAEDCGDTEIQGIAHDSRRVKPGWVFVAISGHQRDGADYVCDALARGAVAIVAERKVPVPKEVPLFLVPNARRALAVLASSFFQRPSRRMQVIGVTGTNGKTTTTYLMEAMLAAAGHRPGVIGTVGYRYAGQEEQAPFTTPTPQLLHAVLRRMNDAGCTHSVMEVSSHALELGRVWGLDFAVAAFTHLTQDHLDLHGSMEAYLQAKLLLFSRHLRPGGVAVINVDGAGADAVVELAARRGDVELLRCSSAGRDDAEATLTDARFSIDGLQGTLSVRGQQVAVSSPMLGSFNGDNVLLAAACCCAAGVELEQVARGVAALSGVPGRLERVDGGREFAVLVDYAHTPDALARAVAVLRPLCRGRLITVFGCGGDRDRTKRPLMGGAVARLADLAVVTSDNPRTEDPGAIIEDILPGVQAEAIEQLPDLDHPRGFVVQQDRRRAIFAAVHAARPGDIVLIAGKGHEDYQILGRERIHFDDREQAREALA